MATAINWNRLVKFIGYGPNTKADVLFLGLEERASQDTLLRNLTTRSAFKQIEDLYEAHIKLGNNGCRNPFENGGNPVRQWNIAARFALAIEGHRDWHDRFVWQNYWRERLGRKDGNTFLMECFPFPRPNRNAVLPQRPPWTEEEVWERRRDILGCHLKSYPPKFVVAYGVPTKVKLEELLSIPNKAWLRVPGVKHQAFVATNGRTRVAHVGFFGRGLFACDDIPTIVAALRKL